MPKKITEPPRLSLPEDLVRIQERWRAAADADVRDTIFAEELGPAFAPLFATLPLVGAPPDAPRPRFLISMLGLSWQPVALLNRWAAPERLLVLGTADSLRRSEGEEGARSKIRRVSGLPEDRVEFREVSDKDEVRIYREVRAFFRRTGAKPREVAVDLTGGKKSMSAAAALAGFLEGAALIYVDYLEYDRKIRSPVACSEYPRLLRNPLDVLGDAEIDRIRRLFDGGLFSEVAHRAADLAERLAAPREAEALEAASRAYGAWDEFRFVEARESFERLATLLERHAEEEEWRWAPALEVRLEDHRGFVERLAALDPDRPPSTLEDGAPLILNHLAAARRKLDQDSLSLATMLTYSAMEKYVDLCLRALFGLDDDKPDYGRIEGLLDQESYDAVGRLLHGEQYERRAPSGKLQYANGAQLLAAMAPERLPATRKALGRLRGLMEARNKTEYEHGLLPPALEQARVEGYWEHVRELILSGLADPAAEDLLAKLAFPSLS